jgi:hypothetical protein
MLQRRSSTPGGGGYAVEDREGETPTESEPSVDLVVGSLILGHFVLLFTPVIASVTGSRRQNTPPSLRRPDGKYKALHQSFELVTIDLNSH